MELGREPEMKKEAQESEDERWARMDKRIERAIEEHDLACSPCNGDHFSSISVQSVPIPCTFQMCVQVTFKKLT